MERGGSSGQRVALVHDFLLDLRGAEHFDSEVERLLAGRPSVLNKVWNATMMKVTAE